MPHMPEDSPRLLKDLQEILLEAQSDIGQAFFVHEDGRLLYGNEVCSRITGYGWGELKALPSVFDLVIPEEKAVLAERMRRRFEGEAMVEHYETAIVHKSGRRVKVEVVVKPLEVGDRKRLVVLLRDITERKRLEEERLRTWEEYEKMIRVLPNIVFRWRRGDDGGVYPTYAEGALAEEFGVTTERVVGKALEELFLPELHDIALPALERAFAGEVVEFTSRIGDRWFANVAMPFHAEGCSSPREQAPSDEIVGFAAEVTEHKRAEEALRESERRFKQLFENSVDALFVIHDETREIVDCNLEARRSLRYSREELLRLRLDDFALKLLPEEEKKRRGPDTPWQRALVGEPGTIIGFHENVHLRKDRTTFPVEVGVGSIDYGGRRMILASCRDVTQRKALEDELAYRVFHDTVTDLPNRALFLDRLSHALSRAERSQECAAVLFLDLDNFKYVNDTLGHHVGDELLVAVSGRLRKCLRPADTAARLGGDEFAVLLEDVESMGEAERVAERIIEELRTPFALGGQKMYVTLSIGITLGSPGQDPPEELLRKADVAMYRAKGEGKARYKVFDPVMEAQVVERLRLENDLRRALERDELKVHYQPVVHLQTGLMIGMEALARWEHPERGLLSPSEFVPLAEETGMIVPIGRLVLHEACRQAKYWQERYPSDPPLIIGVNLSARQLRDPNLVGDVEEALEQSGLDPRSLTLEITESALVGDEEQSMGSLRRLEDLKVRFALDDFGTGYSSLSYLKRLPVRLLKIDRSFVERLGKDPEDEILLSGVIGIATGLGMHVLAEGVETAEQLAHLKSLGCELAQGNYFSGPLSIEAVGALLDRVKQAPGSERS